MKNPFLKSPTSFKPAIAPSSPFREAAQCWDNRLGHSVVQARNWRFAFLLSSILLLLSLLSLVMMVRQQRVVPVIVGLDKETGAPTVVGPVDARKFTPGAVEIRYFLSEFIRSVRTVSLDQIVIRQNWIRAYKYLRPEAAGLLNELAQKDTASPLQKIGKTLVSVQPVSIVAVPETNSYQARWRETVFSAQGQKLDEYTMLATFVIELDPPRDENTLQDNPLGLFIRSFQWNREL